MRVRVKASTSTSNTFRERVKEKQVVIEHARTKLMIADPLTKGMPPMKFKDHVDIMKIVSSLYIYI